MVTLIQVLIAILVMILVLGLVSWLIAQLPVPAWTKQVAYVIVILIAILMLLGYRYWWPLWPIHHG